MTRRYKVTFLSDFIPQATVLMSTETLKSYLDYLGSPRHTELRQLLPDPGPDRFRVETVDVAEHSYLDGLPTEELITRRA